MNPEHRSDQPAQAAPADRVDPAPSTGTSPSPAPEVPKPTEHAPVSARGLRVMAVVRWGLLALVTALAASTVWTYWGPRGDEHAAHTGALYYCPMHPQIRSPRPGHCPICHMNLEPIPDERLQAPAATTAPEPASPSNVADAAPPNVTALTLPAEKQQAIGLVTAAVERATLGERLRVPGVISAPETGLAQVRVRAPGFVESVAVRQTGARVQRGQPLAYVYSPEIYRAQEELLAASRWSAASQGSGAAADLAAAARHSLELLGVSATELEEITRTGRPIRALAVRAPVSGVVIRFGAILGSRADPEMVLYEIADLSTVWIVASIHERELAALRPGMAARFVAADGGAPREGRIQLIEPVLDEATRTTRVRVTVPNRDGALRPGQYGEVELELAAAPGLFVPRDAVIRTGEHDYVYLAIGPDRFEPRNVTTGPLRDGRIQIREGLAEGQRVVTRGSFLLDSESRLQASLAAAPPAPGAPAPGSCEAEIDRGRFPDKLAQCLACERQHAGMGGMVDDCKNAIPRPWR